MMKKIFLLLIIFSLFASGIFSQEEDPALNDSAVSRAKNNVSVGFSILGAGVSYERMFNRHFSVVGEASINTLIVMYEFTASAKARVYPFGRAFFLDVGLGLTFGKGMVAGFADLLLGVITFGVYWVMVSDGEAEPINPSAGFLVQPGLGWKIDIGKPDGFVMPISLGLNIKIAGSELADIMPYMRIGVGYSF